MNEMITFIPSWRDASLIGESMDDLMGQIRAYVASRKAYQIIVCDHVPHLRYFLHRFDILESDYVSLFDELQGFEGKEQKRVELTDLKFPPDVAFVYTPYVVLVRQRSEIIGRVFLGEGLFVSEVHHYQGGKLEQVEVYDDRGFVSSRRFYQQGVLDYTSYLDALGEEIFVQFSWRGDCLVNLSHSHGLKHERYVSIEALQLELLERKLSIRSSGPLVFSVTAQNLPFIGGISQKHKVALSFFSGHYDHQSALDGKLLEVASQVSAIIVDTHKQMDQFIDLGISRQKIHKVSPFDTRFTLSITQELKEEVVYWEARQTSQGDYTFILSTLVNYFWQEMQKEENKSFKLIIRTTNELQVTLEADIESVFKDLFPEEMIALQVLSDFHEVNEKVGIEKDKNQFLSSQSSSKVEKVRELREQIFPQIIWSEEEIFKLIHQTRLIIDLGDEPDLFIQMAGISAGLPQINRRVTEYVSSYENGMIISHEEDLNFALSYYLDQLKHWQEARIFSIQRIKNYSGVQLCKRISDLLGKER